MRESNIICSLNCWEAPGQEIQKKRELVLSFATESFKISEPGAHMQEI